MQDFTAEAALQCASEPAPIAKFDAWNARTVDLPGAYFLQTAEWIFRENRLARGTFPALGRMSRLCNIEAPIFVLAAADDEIVSLPQATAVKALCTRASVEIRVEPGRHLSLFMGRPNARDRVAGHRALAETAGPCRRVPTCRRAGRAEWTMRKANQAHKLRRRREVTRKV